ncbi:hypothetical protein D3C75_849110 [compost metagenome]
MPGQISGQFAQPGVAQGQPAQQGERRQGWQQADRVTVEFQTAQLHKLAQTQVILAGKHDLIAAKAQGPQFGQLLDTCGKARQLVVPQVQVAHLAEATKKARIKARHLHIAQGQVRDVVETHIIRQRWQVTHPLAHEGQVVVTRHLPRGKALPACRNTPGNLDTTQAANNVQSCVISPGLQCLLEADLGL